MLNSIQKAFKVKEVRERLLYTFMMLIVIRIGSCLPIPGVDASFLKEFFTNLQNSGMGFVNAITGGSFSNMSLFALSITPYITSSIIMQLMTIAIPKLEEMQKEGEDGRKKIAEYTRYLTVALALFQSSAMAIGFGKQGLLYEDAQNVWGYMTVIAAMTAGSALLMWIGERITEKGVGNGISIVLLINIVSSLPQDVLMLISHFPQVIRKAMEQSEPSLITRHTTQLAQAYNKYYFEHRIMDESDPAGTAARVNLTRAVRDVIKTGLYLIGVEAPERM